MQRRAAGLVIACFIAFAVGGCGTSQPPTTNHSKGLRLPDTGSSVLTADALDLVTQAGRWPSTEEILNAAIDKLVTRCMQAKHLKYVAVTATVLNNDDEIQIVDLARRQRQGYGLHQPGSSLSNRPQDAYVAGLSPSAQQHYMQALYGAHNDQVAVDLPNGGQATFANHGCQADAIRALAGDITRWGLITYAPQELGNRLANQLSDDANYQAALAEWRRCMAAAGIHDLDPDHAVHGLQAAYQAHGVTPALRRQEITTAVADGKCALQVHLPLTATTSRRALAAQLPEQDRRNLNTLARDRNGAFTLAASILEQP